MEKLIEIKNNYKNEFFKTGNIYFFMMAHNIDNLIKNANAIEKEQINEENLTF